MKKLLLSIGLALSAGIMAHGAKADPRGELTAVFSENFDAMGNGSEADPAKAEISASGKVDVSLTGGAEWGGRGLHEAGGALAVMHFEQSDWFGTESVQGYVRTPYTDVRMDEGRFTLRFRARALGDVSDILHVELYDPYTTNSIDAAVVAINGEWAVCEVDLYHPGYGNHLAYMEIASEDADWLMDDFEIVQDYYALSAPIAHFARNVSYEQFTAYWNPVPLAASYKVSVFSLDDAGAREFLLKDAETNECEMTVEGTQKGKDYYYYVCSVNDRYTSEASEIRKVNVPLNTLETPVTLEAENVTADGFTARWEPTFRAMGYVIGLQKRYVAKEDVVVTLVHEDFGKFTDGDMDWTYPFYGNLDDYTSMPGWGNNYFSTRTAAGMFVIDNEYKRYGEECFLSTPALDLSGDEGRFTVVMKVYGDMNNVVSLTCGGKTVTYTLDVQGMQEFSVEFDNGTETSVIRIEFDGEPAGYFNYLFIDDISVQQYAHAGDAITENVGTYKTTTPVTSYEFTGLNANTGDTFIYTVTAWSYSLDEQGVWGPDVLSEVSEPQSVVIGDESGIDDLHGEGEIAVSVRGSELEITSPEATVAEVYGVNGQLVARYNVVAGCNTFAPAYTGIAIVKVGERVFRVALR